MTDDESDVDAMDILTRREVLSGGGVALLGAMGLAGTASAQTGTEPRIQLGADWEIDDYDDGSGNNNLRIRHQPSGAELVYNATSNQWEPSDGFSTPKLEVTNETLTDVYLSADQNINANSWAAVQFDSENRDELGEYDSTNYEFTPSEAGWYIITVAVGFKSSTDGDRTQVRFRDTNTASDIVYNRSPNIGGAAHTTIISRVARLESNPHQVQARNVDSSDTLDGQNAITYFSVRSAFR